MERAVEGWDLTGASKMPCAQILSELSPFQRERAALQMLQPGYTRKVLDLFRVRAAPAPLHA